jgi:hypothetical protein
MRERDKTGAARPRSDSPSYGPSQLATTGTMERRHAKGSVKWITVLPILLGGLGATNANEMFASVERHSSAKRVRGFLPLLHGLKLEKLSLGASY